MPEPAFRQHASGLYVPEAESRERQVWTKDEGRLLERAAKLLTAKGITLYLGCTEPRCKHAPMTRIRNQSGGLILRCDHADRILQTTF